MSMTEYRICEYCGERNHVSALECSKCGSDLSFCNPVALDDSAVQTKNDKTWKLSLGNEIIVIDDRIEIGREIGPYKHLLASPYVSRRHAVIFLKDGNLVLTDYSSNGTFVNGVRIPKNVEFVLEHGDKIVFADIPGCVYAD